MENEQPVFQEPVTKKDRRRLWLVLGLVIVLIFTAAGFVCWQNPGLVSQIFPAKSPDQTLTDFIKPAFAKYQLQTTPVKPSVPEYKLTLGDIGNLSDFEKSLQAAFSAEQKNALLSSNFFIAQNNDRFYGDKSDDYSSRADDWTGLYEKIGGPWSPAKRSGENSVFISSDFLLHVYHRLVEKEFEYIEQANFYPALRELSQSLLKSSAEEYASSSGEQKESYDRLSAYFLVSSAILDNAAGDYDQFRSNSFVGDNGSDTKEAALVSADSLANENKISDNAKNIAKQELELIFVADHPAVSPLMGELQAEQDLLMPEDYTQFGPRSHYAKNVILRDYFRAMMWFGRMNFLLKSPELTRDAINLINLLSADDFQKWESIYLPTTFFVGQSDDLGIYEYRQAVEKTGGDIAKLQEELKTYRNPQIMSSIAVGDEVFDLTKEELQSKTKGFRLMGQRFTPDAFVFSTLTQGDEKPDEKTGQSLPSTPTALMVSSLMGSEVSEGLLNDWIKNNAPESDRVIADRMVSLSDYFKNITLEQWTQNIYWSWLYTIKSVFTDDLDKTGYPMFVKNEEWNKKNLQCFLGSWTELKHDTLLYAKQSYAELGAGGEEEEPKPVPRGYVEPNVEFLDRLIALTNLTNDGLKQFNLLPETFESRNAKFAETLEFYRQIAVAELQNEKISDEDFEKLRLSPGGLDQILGPVGGEMMTEKDARAALIADIHTDAIKNQILYEANGIPNYIFVAVKDANGTRLTKGLVYSYYEFTSPVGKRLTDQDWQEWAYAQKDQLPPMAAWNKDLIK